MHTVRKRKRIFWGAGIIIVAAAAVAVFFYVRNPASAGQPETIAETVNAFIGDLSASASAGGSVVSNRTASLAADVPGRVEAVHVRVGDKVSKGDILLEFDAAALALNVASAEQNLKLAEAQLAGLLEPARPADVTAAEAAVASAQAQLDDLLAGSSAEEIAAREADLRAAEANVTSSSAQLAQVLNAIKAADIASAEAALAAAEANLKSVEIQYTRNPDPEDVQANTALAQAREQVASAQAALDKLRQGPDQNQVASARAALAAAEAQRDAVQAQLNRLMAEPLASEVNAARLQLAQAEATLANLLRGPTEEQIRSTEAEIEQARINLADAQDRLAAATIVAPFDGLVTAVYVNEGEIAAGPVVELADRGGLEVVLEVDEIDVGGLSVGQGAVIVLDSWPDTQLNGEITAIAPTATVSPGSTLVVYEVHLSLGQTELPIRIGMTADATLTTAEKHDVLLVANQAIHVNRSDGTYSVNKVVGDSVEEVPVTIGLRDDRFTEITGGLAAGDELRIGGEAPRVTFGRPDESRSAEDE